MTYQPTPYAGDLEGLPEYVGAELGRIALALEQLQGGGTLYLSTPAAARSVGTAFEVFDDFDLFSPLRDPRGVEPDPNTLSEIYIKRPGQWGISFVIDIADIQIGREYEARVFYRGVETDIFSVVDASNQTGVVTMVAIGVFRSIGDEAAQVQLRIKSSGADSTWRTVGAYFSMWAVGT